MPTCKIHRDQVKTAGRCRALLPCGFVCGRLYEWTPHGFQLCPTHRKDEKTCHFLRIPVEVRYYVYRYLLPNSPVSARHHLFSRRNGSDGERLYTEILQVNKLLHDEAAHILYGRTAFEIVLDTQGLKSCFSPPSQSLNGPRAIEDYQMQLMLLEQQNKRRLLAARQDRAYLYGESSSAWTSMAPSIQRPTRSPNPYGSWEIEKLWRPLLSERYFDMIRDFRIMIIFPALKGSNSHVNTLESKVYDYCDRLHELIGRLKIPKRNIIRLEITVWFEHDFMKREEAASAARLLLRPFRRISDIVRPKVSSIRTNDSQCGLIDLLVPDWVSCAADRTFFENLKSWSNDPSSSEPLIWCPQILEAYWKMEELLLSIRRQGHFVEPRFHKFTELLHAARIAREDDDLLRFREIWDEVLQIWADYVDQQKRDQCFVDLSIDAINVIVREEPRKNALGTDEGC